MYRSILFLLILSASALPIGQSAVITMVFPTGARSLGMGETGTALADDEDIGFYNPAGLGIFNDRWRRGAVTEFYEPLLPIFNLPELWHHNMAFVYQPNCLDVGGFSVYHNYINFGTNEWTNESGNVIGRARSYEYVLNCSWGFNFKELGLKNHYFGVSGKYARSALAPGFGPRSEGVASTVAFDIGYLWQCLRDVRFGLTLQNMGPAIFYVSEQEKDPIPFTLNLALAYKNDFQLGDVPFAQVRAEVRTNREIVKNYIDKPPDPFWKAIYTDLIHDTSSYSNFQEELDEFNWHLGAELTIFNSFSLREGYLFDKAGARFEHHWGLGFRLLNHFQLDWGTIYSPEGYLKGLFGHDGGSNGSRDGQWSISITFFRMFDWSDADKTWWRVKP